MSTKKKINGVAAADALKVVPAKLDKVELPSDKYGGIRDVRSRMDALVPQIASLTVQIEALNAQRTQMSGEFIELDKRLVDSIKAAAGENGVKLEGENWNFNIPTLTFTKA